ncbi:MAG TPA: mechanosensitive ion channel family protein [Coleofasciculaceae cyanobacterium]
MRKPRTRRSLGWRTGWAIVGVWVCVLWAAGPLLLAGSVSAQTAAPSVNAATPEAPSETAADLPTSGDVASRLWIASSWAQPWVGTEADRPQSQWIEFEGRPVFQIAAPPKELARRSATITTNLQTAGDRYLKDAQGKLDVTIDVSPAVTAAKSAPTASPNPSPAAGAAGTPISPSSPIDAPRILVNGNYIMTVTALDAGTQLTEPRIYAASVKTAIAETLQQARVDHTPAALGQQVRSSIAIWLVALGAHLILGWAHQRLDQLNLSTPKDDPTNGEGFPLTAWLQRQRRDHWLAIGRILIQIAQPAVWVAASLWVLGGFAATRWLQSRILDTLEAYLRLGVAALITYIAILLSYIAIDRATAILTAGTQIAPRTSPRLQQRVLTLSSILKSLLTILLVVVGAIVGLANIGLDVGPLIAGAGLIGVALSLASQNLIKDAINGFLILAEDQFSVGDAIAVGNLTGRVEALTLRVTKLRDAEQRLIVIPNSEIRTVANLSNHYSQADLKIPIAYGANLDRALDVLNQLSDDLAADPAWADTLLDRPQVLGIDDFAANGAIIRVWIRTTPLQQWNAAREFRRRVVVAFAAAQIELTGQADTTSAVVPLDLDRRPRSDDQDNDNSSNALSSNSNTNPNKPADPNINSNANSNNSPDETLNNSSPMPSNLTNPSPAIATTESKGVEPKTDSQIS